MLPIPVPVHVCVFVNAIWLIDIVRRSKRKEEQAVASLLLYVVCAAIHTAAL